MVKLNFIFLLIWIISSCSEKGHTNFDNIKVHTINPRLSIDSIQLIRISFEIPHPVGKGFSVLGDGKILFLHQMGAEMMEFDTEGRFLGIPIQKGSGPSEIEGFQSFTQSNGEYYFLSGYTLHTHGAAYQLKDKKTLDFYHQSSMKEVEENPKADDIGVYEVKYEGNQLMVEDGFLYTKIESTNPKFNMVMHTEYYQTSRMYGKVDLKTGKVVEILGRKPQIYQQYHYIPHFDYFYHHIDGENITLSFEPDSLIYIANKSFEILEAFGNSGVGMDQEYIEVNNVDDWYSYASHNRAQKGFYLDIYSHPEDDVLFRTYTKGNPSFTETHLANNPHRLQIYESKQLIGDVTVPPFFKVIGKIGEYYYAEASGRNIDNEEIVVYKFKLE